jgi:tetratricopeptide (TPR) repeat protein
MSPVVSHSFGSADDATVGKKRHLEAQSRFEDGLYNEAVDLAAQAIRLRPDDAGPIHLRGMAYRRLGRYRDAIDDLSRAIALKSNFAFSYYERGAAYRALAERERTREEKIKAYERARQDETLAIDLARGDNKRDLYYVERGTVNQQLGSLFESESYYERAAQNFLEAILVNPKNGWAYDRLGAVYSVLGDYRKALESYNSALDLLPESERHRVYQDRAAVKDRLPDAAGARQDRLLAKALVEDKKQ